MALACSPRLESRTRKAQTVDQTFAHPRLAKTRVVRPKTKARVIAGDGNDSSIFEDFNDAKMIDDAVVVEIAARGRVNITRVGSRLRRHLLLPINESHSHGELRLEKTPLPQRSFEEKGGRRWQDDQMDQKNQDSHLRVLPSNRRTDAERAVAHAIRAHDRFANAACWNAFSERVVN
jgi:hypothetical protein